MLSKTDFLTVIHRTPLVSIDLVIRNANGQILLGKRLNRPAQGYWFVPGGRVRKNERLADAFERLVKTELGLDISFNEACLLGVYEHFYDDNFAGASVEIAGDALSSNSTSSQISTHYVVSAYELILPENADPKLDDQHNDQAFWTISDILSSNQVHENTKAYFRSENS